MYQPITPQDYKIFNGALFALTSQELKKENELLWNQNKVQAIIEGFNKVLQRISVDQIEQYFKDYTSVAEKSYIPDHATVLMRLTKIKQNEDDIQSILACMLYLKIELE